MPCQLGPPDCVPPLPDLPYEPQPRQRLLHESTARQIVWGGAAGGGKSHASRWDLILLALRNPGMQGYLFRRTRRMLESTHIRPIKRELAPYPELGKYNGQRNAFEFSNGSVIYMCYCDTDDDAFGYLSEEMHACLIDEAVQFSPEALSVLKTRVRLGGWKPLLDVERLPRFVMATNPGGPSHSYIKSLKDQAPPETVFHDAQMRDPTNPQDRGWTTIFIPSRMSDNRYLDIDYGAAFGMLSPEMQRAYREGDWDVVLGAALHNLRRDVHCLGIFQPPRHWLRFCAMDWGMAKPFSIGWYAVCDDDVWVKFKHSEGGPKMIPRGAVIRYKELYGWGGKAGQGCAWPPARVAQAIKAAEADDAPIAYRVADTEIWAVHGGPCVMEMFADQGIYWCKAQKDRARNYAEMLARLAGEGDFLPDGRSSTKPMFFVTRNCLHWWRTVPTLMIDPLEPEKGPATKNVEDHCYDESAYGLRSRPWIAEPLEDDGREDADLAPYERIRLARVA